MSRNSRDSIRSKVAKQIQETQRDVNRPKDTRTGREQLQSVLAPEIVTLPGQEKPPAKPQIVLYLRTGLNPADKNFTKYPNAIHSVMLDRLVEMSSGILYMYLWRQSWGYGRNYCRTSYQCIEKDTLIGSKKTAQRAMNRLVEVRFAIRALTTNGDPDVNQQGALYRVLTPSEIEDGVTEEGVSVAEIPQEGVVMMTIATMTTPANTGKTGNGNGVVTMTTGHDGYGHGDYSHDDYKGMDTMAIATMTTPDAKLDATRPDAKDSHDDYSNNDHPLKEDSIKDSLSPDPVIYFYSELGQTKISNDKREKAKASLQELLADGFSLEEIQFAVEWTIENAKEKPYDFSIIKHTIGQAMAAKEEAEATAERKLERERTETQKQAEEKKRDEEKEKIDLYKEALSPEERTELRKTAEAEIKESGQYKTEFITDILIEAQENQIIRAEIESSENRQED